MDGEFEIAEALRALENLEEDLSITGDNIKFRKIEQNFEDSLQGSDCGIEWSSRNGGVHNVGCSDGVRREKSHGFGRGEPSVGEAGQNFGNAVRGLRDCQIGSGCQRWGPSEHELQARCTRAVGSADSSCQVNTRAQD